MLDSSSGWAAASSDTSQWMQIDLGAVLKVKGVVTQGRSDEDQRVTSFQVSTSVDGSTWSSRSATFDGNSDRHTKIENMLSSAVDARYVRFHPVSWDHHVSMRAGVIACQEGD